MAQVAGNNQIPPAPQSPSTVAPHGIAHSQPPDLLSLPEQGALFRSIADSVPTMIWTTGLDMGVTFLNKVWFDYTGFPVEQAMGHGWLNAFHPDDRTRISQSYTTAFQQREPFTFEARKIYRGTEYRWVAANGVPNFDPSGTFTGYIGTCQDVTERRQADEEARLLHRIILAIEAVDDLDTTLTIVLKEICEATGWVCAQVWMPNPNSKRLEAGKAWYCKNMDTAAQSFRHQNQCRTFMPGEGWLGKVWASREPVWVEDLSREASFSRFPLIGSAHFTSALGVPVVASSNALPETKPVLAVLEFFRTEFIKEDAYIIRLVSSVALQLGLFIQKKIMEQVARDNNERFELLQRATHDSIYDWDFATNQLHWNENTSLMFRYPMAQIGASLEWWSEKIHPDDRNAVVESMHQAIQNGRDAWLAEYRFLRGDGTYCYVKDRGYIAHDADGRPVRMIGSMLDMTDWRIAEAQLRESEKRFRIMAEASPVMLWTFDAKTETLTYANQRTLEFLKLTLEELTQLNTTTLIRQRVHPDDLDVFLTKREAALKAGIGYQHEFRLRYQNNDNEYRWILGAVGPRIIYSKEFQGYIGSAVDITERKTAEDQLRESEKRFRTMAEASTVMIWVFDENRNALTYGNQKALDFLGISLDELTQIDMPSVLKQFIHPDDLAAYMHKRKIAMQAGIGYEHECRVRYHNSQHDYHWVLLSVGARLRRGKDFQGFIGTMLDITERKLTEQALKESETLLKTMADTVPAMIWMVDADMNVGFHNRAYLEYTGLNLNQIQRLNVLDIIKSSPYGTIHPDDIQRYAAGYLNAFEKRQPFTYEIRLKHHSGEYRWMIFSGRPRFDNEGYFAGYIGSYMDIHELKEGQIKLAESEERFRNMADTAPFMIIMSELEEDCCHFNRAWQDFTGMKQDMVRGHYWFTLQIHPADRRFCLEKYRTAVQTHQTGNFEFRLRRHDGVYRWVLAAAAPRYGDQGKLIGFIGSCIDITEIRQYRTELEHTVALRTQELETVNKELESFSYSVSHDLRAPLRGIDGMSQLVYQDYYDRLDEQGKHYLQILRREAQRMAELINDMLNLSRLTRGAMRWNQVDLSRLAEEIADGLKEREPDRNVQWIIQPNLIARGDANLLRVVLDNLFGNAWKFTAKHPTARIEFGATESPDDHQRVYFVKDDGAGFEMDYADNLFGAFQRLHDESEFPGTGIGLATVQRIIHRHGGKIWAHAEVEKGAQLFFTLGGSHE